MSALRRLARRWGAALTRSAPVDGGLALPVPPLRGYPVARDGRRRT